MAHGTFYGMLRPYGADLLRTMEDFGIKVVIPGDMNSNFVDLIPKKSLTEDFGNFFPNFFMQLCIQTNRKGYSQKVETNSLGGSFGRTIWIPSEPRDP